MATQTFRNKLAAASETNNSALCVGLDPDPKKFPGGWRDDPRRIFEFCTGVVGVTSNLAQAYKPNIAFFSAYGAEDQLEQVIHYIARHAPGVPVILDAKRGDIGSTAEHYAREAFERYGADAVTLSPYLGQDSIEPYLRYEGKGVILLTKTSNPGSGDLQDREVILTEAEFQAIQELLGYELPRNMSLPLWQFLAYRIVHQWQIDPERLGLVVGATYPAALKWVRAVAGREVTLLAPGMGAQGALPEDIMAVWTGSGSVIANVSRSILYPKLIPGEDYFAGVRRVAKEARDLLNQFRNA